MDVNIATAAISAGSSVLVAVVALVLNHFGFRSLEGRLTGLDARMLRLEQRMDTFQHDLLEHYKTTNDLDKRVTRLEDKP